MDFKEYAARLDGLEAKYIQFWEDICNIESPSASKEGVDAVGAFLIDKAKEFGWTVQQNTEEMTGNALCLTMNAEVDAPAICFSGHMDTVHPVGSFGSPAVHLDEEFIYGPGVADCKGGIVASVFAMDALQSLGYKERPIKLILQADEEVSSMKCDKRNTRFMAEMAKGCRAFLNMEPHGSVGADKIGDAIGTTVQRKGIQRYRFHITGLANHSSRCDKAVNAVAEAAYKILELEKMKDPDGTTCNCSMISGGTTPNSVPETCEFTADIRYVDQKALAELEKTVQRIADTSYLPGSKCEVKLVSYRICMERTEVNLALLEEANAILKACGVPQAAPILSAGGSDAADMTAARIPTLDSFGVQALGTHSIREHSSLSSLKESALRIGALAIGLR